MSIGHCFSRWNAFMFLRMYGAATIAPGQEMITTTPEMVTTTQCIATTTSSIATTG